MSNSFVTPSTTTARFFCTSLSLRVCSDSCPLSWWCHPTISSSVIPFSFCLKYFPASEDGGLMRNWDRLNCKYWRNSCGGGRQLWLTEETKTLEEIVLQCIHWKKPSWRAFPTAHVLQCWDASGQATNRMGTHPHPSGESWLQSSLVHGCQLYTLLIWSCSP